MRIIKLIKYAELDDKELIKEVKEVKKCCTTCGHYKKPNQRSAAGFSLTRGFDGFGDFFKTKTELKLKITEYEGKKREFYISCAIIVPTAQ